MTLYAVMIGRYRDEAPYYVVPYARVTHDSRHRVVASYGVRAEADALVAALRVEAAKFEDELLAAEKEVHAASVKWRGVAERKMAALAAYIKAATDLTDPSS